jgi:hypothetical protein
VASRTFYLRSDLTNFWSRLSESGETAANTGFGWTVDTGATNHSEYASGVERAAATFVDTAPPDGSLDLSLRDAFRTELPLNGSFSSGNWEFHFVVRAGNTGGAQDGRVRFRLLKGSNSDGSGATEITAEQKQASIVSDVSTSADFDSTLTVNPGAITLTFEYLFIQVAWERTGAGAAGNSDINFRTGTDASTGTRIITSDFTQAHGIQATSAQGSVSSVGATIAVQGQSITVGQGTFEDQRGQAFFAEQGSLSPGIVMSALVGQAITSAQGTVAVSITGGGGVTVHIDGVEAVFSQDTVVIGPTLLTGSSSTSAAGSVTPSSTLALTGSAITSGAGSVAANQEAEDTYITSASGSPTWGISKALTGSAITSGQGSVTASALDKTVPISGELIRILSQSGTATPSRSIPLSGQAITSALQTMGAPGFAALTGSSITVEQGFLGRALAISGQEITSAQGTIVGLPGLVALVGEGVSVQQGTMTPSGTQWIPEGQPTTTWTPPASPNSSWTRKDGPSTSWNRKT